MFGKILIANRGEIARRVARTCRRLGIATVAVHSDADVDAPHVREADEAVRIGPPPAAASYLDVDAIIQAAVRTGADALHPGYGFLAESPDLAAACVEEGITFVGPRPETVRLMADKGAAKRHLAGAGVPTIPGTDDDPGDVDAIAAAAEEIGYPVLLKAIAGGGGKGMRLLDDASRLSEAVEAVRREAASSFGDDRLLVEKAVERPRHIEVQVFGDGRGGVVHLFERECSIQRRHQKIVEETPSPALDEELRGRICDTAVTAAASVDYLGAGTVEMLLSDVTRDFFFLEMNTRLQVEHPVTEMTTGVDLVEWQLRVAAGEGLPLEQAAITSDGHAIEVRLYAEDPADHHLPQTGDIRRLRLPARDGLRIDSGVEEGSAVSPHYDPMLAKIIAHADDRRRAIELLDESLRTASVLGVTTNLDHLRAVITSDAFRAGDLTTSFLEEHLPDWRPDEVTPRGLLLAALATSHVPTPTAAPRGPWGRLGPWRLPGTGGWRVALRDRGDRTHEVRIDRTPHDVLRADVDGEHLRLDEVENTPRQVSATIDGERVAADVAVVRPGSELAGGPSEVWVRLDGVTHRLRVLSGPRHADAAALVAGEALTAPMPGTVAAVNVAEGDRVEAGDVLLVVEAMKMEHPVVAHADGLVAGLHVAVGDSVETDVPLIEVEPAPTAEEEAGHGR